MMGKKVDATETTIQNTNKLRDRGQKDQGSL